MLAWCGLVAEEMAELPLDTWPQQDMESFEDYQNCFMDDSSATDVAAISGHPQKRRTLKTAWNIIVKRRADVDYIARRLLETGGADDRQPEMEAVLSRPTRYNSLCRTGRNAKPANS